VTKGVFIQLCNNLQTKNSTSYFIQKAVSHIFNLTSCFFLRSQDCTGKLGLTAPQKITSALQQLGYGVSSDATNEYVCIGETTARKTLKMFTQSVIEIYGSDYLRKPTEEDLRGILQENATRGFPGCLGSLDCMHVGWNPRAWASQFTGKEKEPTIILEAAAFFKSVPNPSNSNLAMKNFNTNQEAVQKDIKRAFGVLQSKWHILTTPVCMWYEEDIKSIVLCCIILHNMMVEEGISDFVSNPTRTPPGQSFTIVAAELANTFQDRRQLSNTIRSKQIHHDLTNSLIKYQWEQKGNARLSLS
jgi:hypothetical protein